jgi:N-acetylglucosaminyldiphosphoundecaprenol N-acetyl-beta-D-mannosaminyltransferase
LQKISICDIRFDNICQIELKKYFQKKNQNTKFVVTPNVDFIARAYKNKSFKQIILNSDLSICDSSILYYFSYFLKYKIKSILTGDIATKIIFNIARKKNEGIYLLGGTDIVLKNAKQNLEKNYNDIKICGVNNGYFAENETAEIIKNINQSNSSFLLVGLGSPKQEEWCYYNKDKLNVKFIICIGGLLNIFSGNTRRAPIIIQKLALEWLWRLISEPKRLWKRYLINDFIFFPLISKQIFSRKRNNIIN